MAPTFGEMDMSLSLRITSRFASMMPALLSASNACPPDSAPSPMTAMTWMFATVRVAATAMPSAALIEVLECPTPRCRIRFHRAAGSRKCHPSGAA